MRPEAFFKDEGLIALTSEGPIDFTPVDFDSFLSSAQRAYLQKKCGVDIPQVFWRKQVHGDDILMARGGAGASKGCCDADAYITDEKICLLPYARQIACRFSFLIPAAVP